MCGTVSEDVLCAGFGGRALSQSPVSLLGRVFFQALLATAGSLGALVMQTQVDGACPDDDPMVEGLEPASEALGARRAFADRVGDEGEGGGDVGRPPASPLMGMVRRPPFGGRPPAPPAMGGTDR